MSSKREKQKEPAQPSSSGPSDDAPKVTQEMLDGARFRVDLQDVPRKIIKAGN